MGLSGPISALCRSAGAQGALSLRPQAPGWLLMFPLLLLRGLGLPEGWTHTRDFPAVP